MTTYSEAVEQTITAGEQIHQIINGTATTEVTVEDGSKVPSIRKALLDNFYFKDPIAWQTGQTETVFNQLRQFTDGSWWYAPSATSSNPITMGSTPVGDPLWKIYDFDAIGKLEPRIDEALRRSYAEAGYNVVGTFQAGFTIVNANDVGIDEVTGKGFTGPAGPVSAGTDPAGGGFVDRSGELLASKVQYRFSVSAVNNGAVADRTTDNTSLIQSLINSKSNCYITIEPNILWHSKLITMKDGVNIIDMSGWDDEYAHWENSVKEFYNTANAGTTNGNTRHIIARHHPAILIDNRGGDSDPEGAERRASVIYRYKGRLVTRAGIGITNGDNNYVITNRNLSAMFAFANTNEGDFEIGYGGQHITGIAHAFRARPENTGSATIARFYANSGQNMVYQTYVGATEVRRETISPDGSSVVTIGGVTVGGYSVGGGHLRKAALLSSTSSSPAATTTGSVIHNAEMTTTSTYVMPVGISGLTYAIHKVGSGNITINLRPGDTFDDGATTKTITEAGSRNLVCYAANKWYLI